MQARLEAQKVSPAAYQAMLGLEMFVRKQSKLEPALIQLVKMRASQINGCAYCIDMHSKDARAEARTQRSHSFARAYPSGFRVIFLRILVCTTIGVTPLSEI
jgi:AhpD family alkylhydroperoxidase